MLTRKTIMQKTQQVGAYTLLSRLLGVIREYLTVRYMGADALADAFFTAWKVPNSLRKIFAEGALSAVFIPTVTHVIRSKGKHAINGLMLLGFLFFEGIVLLLCSLVMSYPYTFIAFIAPGFSPDQIMFGAQYLRILMPFIFLISTSALLAGPLQAIGHFFIPAFGPVLLNIVYIVGLVICSIYAWPITMLCWFIMAGGVVQLIAHIIAYIRCQFTFGLYTRDDVKKIGWILIQFIPSFLSMSVMEVGLLIDTSFATLLSKGSVSLIHYANRFMGIPLGVFSVALSTTLLPHFARISSYAPKRLGFYLLEAAKLVWWVTIPITVMMMFLSKQLFITLFLSDKFSLLQANEASRILIASLIGLFFFSINKILLNVYYALHKTIIPAIIAVFVVGINVGLNWLLIDRYQAVGLALATTVAVIIQTILLYGFLVYQYNLRLYFGSLVHFMWQYTKQLFVVGVFALVVYYGLFWMLCSFGMLFFIEKIGFWLWAAPLCLLFMGALYVTRHRFGIRVLFLE